MSGVVALHRSELCRRARGSLGPPHCKDEYYEGLVVKLLSVGIVRIMLV